MKNNIIIAMLQYIAWLALDVLLMGVSSVAYMLGMKIAFILTLVMLIIIFLKSVQALIFIIKEC